MAVCDKTGVKSGRLQVIDPISQNPQNPQFPYDPCTNYWTCHGIKIIHEKVVAGQVVVDTRFDETTAGFDPANVIPNQIQVKVFNATNQEIRNVNVEAWVCDFTMGVTFASSLPSANPAQAPMTGFTASIPPGGNQIIRCSPNWVTTQPDVGLNGGHVCIAVNCYTNPQDPNDDSQDIQGQVITGGPTGPNFNFCCDAHQAQRNIAVRQVTPMMKKEGGFNFKFFAANPNPDHELEAVLEIKRATGMCAFGPNEQQLLLSGPHAAVRITDDRGCQLVLKDPHETPIHESPYDLKEVTLEGNEIGRGNHLKVMLPPKERIPVTMRLKFAPEDDLGGFHTFDVTETDMEGNVVGGVRIMTLFINDEKP